MAVSTFAAVCLISTRRPVIGPGRADAVTAGVTRQVRRIICRDDGRIDGHRRTVEKTINVGTGRCSSMTGNTVSGTRRAIIEIAVVGVVSHRQHLGVVVQARCRVEAAVGGIGVTLRAPSAGRRDSNIPVGSTGGVATKTASA